MAKNKYVSLSKLSTFLENLKGTFASLSHKHTISDLTDYKVDTTLSSTSVNPVQNKVLDAEFDAIATAMNVLETAIDGKASSSHAHNDIYYTESEIDTKLASKSDSTHNHDSKYDAKGSASAVQENLNVVSDTLSSHTGNSNIHVTASNKTNWNSAYTHSTSAHARTDATKVEDSATNGNIKINGTETNVYSHPNSGVTAGTYKSVTVNAQGHVTGGSNPTTLSGYGITDAETKTDASAKLTEAKSYADTAATKVKNDLLNGAGTAYDTLKELGDLISENVDAIDALETVAAGKADKTHSHAISDVSGLQSALDGKAASSHGTHVSYSTTAPVMDGTASVGSASTVARSDHKHPTDTSRASKTEFDTHASDTTKHITSTERTNWGTAYTHSQAAHAPSNAEKNQNAFSNITVGSTTVSADTATDTVTFVGSNVTITPDATNDKITFAVADGSTSGKGIVQLTNSTSSTSTTTAATPSSVKAAYDLANTAKDIADNHTHDYLPLTGGTVTGTTVFSKSTDIGESSYTSPALVVGGTSSQPHLEIDNNEIKAKRNETETDNLFLNDDITVESGAMVGIGGTVDIDANGLAIASNKAIFPETALTSNIGKADLPFNHMYGRYLELYGAANTQYGRFRVGTTGTTSTEGTVTLELGNATATGTAHNASGKITLYGSGTGFTNILPNEKTSGSNSVYMPTSTGTLITDEETTWKLIHDSGAITSKVNSISNIDVSGYKKLRVVVKCINSANSAAKTGSVIFKSSTGTTYQFPVWSNLFTTSASNSAGMAEFDIINGYIVCPYASRSIKTSNFMAFAEGGTADNLVPVGGGILRCTNPITSLTVSSLDQDSTYYFGVGSRVFVWGCNA